MDTTETLNGTYFYGGLSNLTPQQLWWAITIAVVSDHLGISAVDAALVISGQPVLPTRGKPRGTTPGTSIASKYISNWLNYKLPPGIRLPTLTGKTINSLQLSSTNNLGRFVGRNVPWLGWVMTFTTIYDIQRDIKDTFNRMAVPKDRIQWTYF
ncbi:STM2901 family protein [Salmonella enterica subsp. enterica serovar Infantis]